MSAGRTSRDDGLVRRALEGDKEALKLLYLRYLSDVYHFVYARTGTRADAEDLTSETFLRMLQELKQYRGDGPFRGWLLGIARHVVLDFWRRHYRIETASLEAFGESIANRSGEPSSGTGELKGLNSALQALPDHYRRVLELRFLEGRSIEATAMEMGCTQNTAKVRQHRALRRLAESIGAPGRAAAPLGVDMEESEGG